MLLRLKEKRAVENLKAKKAREWLEENEERTGARGYPMKPRCPKWRDDGKGCTGRIFMGFGGSFRSPLGPLYSLGQDNNDLG